MKKLLPMFAGALFAAFALGVAGAVMFYSWNGLSLVFPGDLIGQAFGLTLFDIAMLVWFLVFVSRCEATMQYVISGFGFLIGLAGTLGLVGIEIGLSSGMLEAGSMQRPLTYIVIGVLVGHLILIYGHHAASPKISAGVALGVERAKVLDRAGVQAEKILAENIDGLAVPIAQDLVRGVLADLGLTPARGQILDVQALDVVQDDKPKSGGGAAGFLSGLFGWLDGGGKNRGGDVANAPDGFGVVTKKQVPAQIDADNGERGGGGQSVAQRSNGHKPN